MRNPLRFPRSDVSPKGVSIRPVHWVAFLMCMLLAACAPALDWREARLPASGLTLLFPCKPQSQARTVEVAGQPWSASLAVCEAGGMTFAAMVMNPPDGPQGPPSVPPDRSALLADMAGHAQVRWGPPQPDVGPPAGVRLPEGSGRVHWSRHHKPIPGATPVATQALFMMTPQGLAQLSVHGERLSDAALEGFFGQLKVGP